MSVLLRRIFSNFNTLRACEAVIRQNNAPTLSALSHSRLFSNAPVSYEVVDEQKEKLIQKDVIEKINSQIAKQQQGRLFAIVHVAGKQFKITEGDVVVIEGYWPPDAGDKLKLDKVLLVGAAEFSLVGRPLVEDGLVNIYATVIEKTLSHTKTNFKKKRRKQYKNINFYRVQQTMLRINTIEIAGQVNSPPRVTGTEHKLF